MADIEAGGGGGVTDSRFISPSTGKPFTQAERESQTFATRLIESDEVISELESKFTGNLETARFLIPEAFKGENRKLIEQAQRNFVNALLRQESGAAIGADEFKSATAQYFPQPNDTKKNLAQKIVKGVTNS